MHWTFPANTSRMLAAVLLAAMLGLSACGVPEEEPVLGTATLSWDAPTTTMDGSPVTIAGHRVYHSTTSPVMSANSEITDVGNQTSQVFSGLGAGKHYFAVTAYNLAGEESGFSDEAVINVP